MQADSIEKQMSFTHKKDKIFNVRKVNYKQYEHNEKCNKIDQQNLIDIKANNLSPGYKKEYEAFSSKGTTKINDKNGQLRIISSSIYKQLGKKYKIMKQQHCEYKYKQLQELRLKQQELNKFKIEKQRIQNQRIKLVNKRDQLRNQIQEIRQKNQMLRNQQYHRNQEYRIMNMEYLRNIILGMRYQNGMDIDLDNMSYQELLHLQQKIGTVNKGLSQQQLLLLPKKIYNLQPNQTEQLCPICYQNAQQGEQMTILPCQHLYHTKCIQEWLIKQKICPMCKQQIINKISSTKKINPLQNQDNQNPQQNVQ